MERSNTAKALVNVCKIPKLVDNKRKGKGLSQAQRDHLLLKQEQDDAAMKQQMVDAFDRSNQTLDYSITRMTNCLSSLGEGIASGMQMLAMALAGQHHINPILIACRQYLSILTTISQDSHNPTHTQEMNLQGMFTSFLKIKKKMIFILYEVKLLG